MTDISKIIININDFLTIHHNLEADTVSFLISLKRELLEFEEEIRPQYKISPKRIKKELSEIETYLRTCGKSFFVQCYQILKQGALGEINDVSTAIQYYMKAKDIKLSDNSSRTKASVGMKIFREGLQIDALNIIATANKVDNETRGAAHKLLQLEQKEEL